MTLTAPPLIDVAIVGAGPVGRCAALALAQHGLSVALVERRLTPHAIPRACYFDHEIHRILLALGLGPELQALISPTTRLTWFNQHWQVLLDTELATSISGGPLGYTFNQPELETLLDRAVDAQPLIQRHAGWDAAQLTQDPTGCTLQLQAGQLDSTDTWQPGAARQTIRSHYVIGADGAHSMVRKQIGSAWHNLGFEADWLVVDVDPQPGWTMSPLTPCQWCNPERPTTLVPTGPRTRRWEFMLLPGETVQDMQDSAHVWSLLAPWIRPDQGRLIRHTVYRFRSLVAEHWQAGRIFIMGDAAHLMPPFMGQGMCSGIRDAWNLAWKLAAVRQGRAGPELLRTYQDERATHVTALTRMVIEGGQLLCITDAAQASARDAMLLSGSAPPPPPMPALNTGLRAPGQAAAGHLGPHDEVQHGDHPQRLDQLAHPGFVLLCHAAITSASLSAAARQVVDELGIHVVTLSSDPASPGQRLRSFLAEQGWTAALLRPDFYVYGGVADVEQLNAQLLGLQTQMGAPISGVATV